MPELYLFRHGKRHIDTREITGDGPLTPFGEQQVQVSAEDLRNKLHAKRVRHIDAVVSGSIRCAQTFGIIWEMFHSLKQRRILIRHYDMDRQYYCTPAEGLQWSLMYEAHGTELLRRIDIIGEKTAVLGYAGNLVRPCVRRTVNGIKKALEGGSDRILVVTHAPHDTLIEEHFTGKPVDACLGLGQCKIVRF